jgi:ABC-2 type transport system ATP-binding protein
LKIGEENMNAIEVKNLTKRYDSFKLDASFVVPTGTVCGFIGRNGAGKTTTLKCLIGMTIPETGEISILGKPISDEAVKADLGVLFDQPYFQEDWTVDDIQKVLMPYYEKWNSSLWEDYLSRFELPKKTKFKNLSRGMKMKLGIAAALSHDTKMLIFDEPTGGLDAVVREDILDILREYMIDETHTIFFSTHITRDLERIADRIILMSGGKVIINENKDDLLESYALVHGNGFDELRRVENIAGLPANVVVEKPTLDDIVVYFERGNVK